MSPMGESPAVRPATSGDLAEIRELGRRTLEASHRPIAGAAYADHVYDTWWSPQALATSLERTTTLVATWEGGIVGVANLGERDGVPVLWKLFVLPGHHGLGIGTRLLAEAQTALPAGASHLRLAYIDGNEPAAGFYRSRGFREVEREQDADGWPDQIWMEREISAVREG